MAAINVADLIDCIVSKKVEKNLGKVYDVLHTPGNDVILG